MPSVQLFTYVMGSFSPSMSRCVSNLVPTRIGSSAFPSFTAEFVPAHPRHTVDG